MAKIIKDLSFIVAHTQELCFEEFENDEVLLDSVMFRLIQVSEKSSKLTSKFKEIHKEIPFRSLKGLRNRIVHEYGNVDLTIIYNTIKNDIPVFLRLFESSK